MNLLGGEDDLAVAVSVAGRGLSRSDLFAAAAVVGRRVGGARAVAVYADASLETVVGVVGCVLAGVPFVPLAPDAGHLEREHVLRDSGAALLLGGPGGEPIDVAARAAAPAIDPPPGATACVMYTSGTTGPPKGVVLRCDALARNLDALADAWGWTAGDVLVHGLPLFHVHGLVLGVLGALRVGSPLVHTGRPDPAAYAAAGGSLYFGVPTVWSRIAADRGASAALRGARLLVSGSASLPASTAHALSHDAGHVPVERYGMTETLITLAARHDEERVVGCVGRALPGVEARLVDDELQVRAPWMFDGYLGLAEITAAGWTDDGWWRTGDAATVDGEGRYRIVGRMSVDLIKSGGFRVGAGEVEDALLTHPAVREAAVVGIPDDDLGQRIVAFVVGDRVSEADLAAHVATVLSVHKRPREVRFLDALPRNAMGKVRKTDLLSRD
ncbi:MAG TPA: AMP-binding protein [Acidimicrobiales bacterium]|nr:AMP-binding protein [Acidimicrobiales bacterium]